MGRVYTSLLTAMHSAVSLIAIMFLCSCQVTFSFLRTSLSFATGGVVSSQPRSTKLTMAAAKPDQLPADAKRYYVRPDRILDLLTSTPQVLLRLGSGALVDGYRGETSCRLCAYKHDVYFVCTTTCIIDYVILQRRSTITAVFRLLYCICQKKNDVYINTAALV